MGKSLKKCRTCQKICPDLIGSCFGVPTCKKQEKAKHKSKLWFIQKLQRLGRRSIVHKEGQTPTLKQPNQEL